MILKTKTMSFNFEQQLKIMLHNEPYLFAMLKSLYQIAPEAYLSAGIIRNWVWSCLHDQIYCFEGTEVDVIYYDEQEQRHERAFQIQQDLERSYSKHQWDITNQAQVHHWYRTTEGLSIAPFKSIEEALASWPETATAVAVRLNPQSQIEVIAPFGLADLFELKLRWNHRLVPRGVFEERVRSKQFLKRWPKLTLIT